MALLNTTQYRITAEDVRSSGALNSGDAIRLDGATGTFDSVTANAFVRNGVISEIPITRGTTKTPPADGEGRPRVYDSGVTDMGDRTYTCYWDDDSDDENPVSFFKQLRDDGAEVQIVDYPDSGDTAKKLTATYQVTGVKAMKPGGDQQMLEVTLQFNGRVFTDDRV